MSGHEQERLSAYLDGELPDGARAEVAAHLDACAECAARLAELAAVDEAAAALSSAAPDGYFESFPARVRARLTPRTERRRLPAWTWAAAAALLLAVVTPLTLLRRPAPALPAAREAPAAPPAVLTPRPAPQAQAPVAARAEPKPELSRARPVPAAATPLQVEKREAYASAPGEAGASATVLAPEQAAAPALAPAPAASEPEAKAASDELTTGAAVGAGVRSQDAPLPERRAQGRAANSAAGAIAPLRVAAEADFPRLAATRPRTPAEWRLLREEWRRFVTRDPAGAQADEARVRTIEAGREAWRGGGDPADEAVFRGDAAAYLEREDAAQKERIRRLVAEAARP